jgi:bacterioferritin-associated ferredoxin
MIDRCVCHDKTFAELIEIAGREGLDYDALADATGCGRNCGLCEPFVKTAIRTGEVVFTSVPEPDTKPN